MDEYTSSVVKDQFLKGMYQPPSSLLNEDSNENKQFIKVLTEHQSALNVLKMELRGEQLFQDEQGERYWVQTDKPMFVKLNKENKPIKVKNARTGKEEFLVNDDAVNEVINTLKACGLNQITPLAAISEDEWRADLLEMESKITVLLTVKRKAWGIDSALTPIYIGNLKIMIKDARSRAIGGIGLKAVKTVTSRIEQSSADQRPKTIGERLKGPFG